MCVYACVRVSNDKPDIVTFHSKDENFNPTDYSITPQPIISPHCRTCRELSINFHATNFIKGLIKLRSNVRCAVRSYYIHIFGQLIRFLFLIANCIDLTSHVSSWKIIHFQCHFCIGENISDAM